MSQAKALKETLENIHVLYNRHYSALERAANSTTSSVRNLQLKIDNFSEALDNLTTTHTTWKLKSEFSDEDLADQTYSAKWLEERWDEADDLLDKACDALHSAEQTHATSSLQSEQVVLVEQMTSLKVSITNRINAATREQSAETILASSHTAVTDVVGNVEKQLNDSYRQLSKTIINSTSDSSADIIAEHELFYQTQEKRIIDLQLLLARRAPTSPIHSEQRTSGARSISIEKSQVPTFSGKTIDYPEFKKGWKKVAAGHWDDGNQLEQMKFKVDPHTKRILSRCKDMTEVWEALDKEYGQEQEVVNAINRELTILRSEELSTPEFIVKLRNYLPGFEEALSAVNGLEHLQTPDKVNFLVEKFDERYQHDWEYYKSKAAGRSYEKFFNFLKDRYDSCRSTIARLGSREASSTPIDGVINRTSLEINHCVKCSTWVAEGSSRSCPACGHTTSVGEPLGHCLLRSSKYESMTPNERSNCIENTKWCPLHLSSTHDYQSCTQKSSNRLLCGINGCTKHHHRSLHGSTTPFVVNINTINAAAGKCDATSSRPVLLTMQLVSTPSGDLNAFMDNGSDCCLILNSAAKRLQLRGEAVTMSLTTCIGVVTIDSYMYQLDIIDINDEKHTIKVFGVEWISGEIQRVDIAPVKEYFSVSIQEMWSMVSKRPTGDVELLIGSNYLSLHPSELEVHHDLKVMKSIFGSGLLLVGSDPALEISHTMQHLNASVSVQGSVRATKLTYKSIREYFDSNELQVEAPRRCTACMNCVCVCVGHQMSLREQFEHKVMEDNVVYDDVQKVFRVNYSFIEDPSILTYNVHQVIKIAEREELKLEKENLKEEFNTEFDKMLSCGALIELTENDMKSWKGPAHWVSLQHVLKPESTTTPLRIVTNSSLPDRNGNSVNSILMKGPNSLSDQRAVVSQWRCYERGLSSDVTKAYYSMKTGELEMHIRRVVWRYCKTDHDWRHFAFQTVSFGDKPAGVYLDVVLNKTAVKFAHIDPPTAIKIVRDRYVDDLATGGSPSEVKKMAGNSVNDGDQFQTDGTL